MHIISLIVCYIVIIAALIGLLRLDKKCRNEALREKELGSAYGENNDDFIVKPHSSFGVEETFRKVEGLDN